MNILLNKICIFFSFLSQLVDILVQMAISLKLCYQNVYEKYPYYDIHLEGGMTPDM